MIWRLDWRITSPQPEPRPAPAPGSRLIVPAAEAGAALPWPASSPVAFATTALPLAIAGRTCTSIKDNPMADFSSLLNAASGTAVKPKALVPGFYRGVVKGWAPIEAPKDKEYKTIIRFILGLTAWPEDAEPEDKIEADGKPVALAAKQLRRDFYDHRLFDLDEFLRSVGVEPDGSSYATLLPRTIGAAVTVEVSQYINQKSGEIGNQVNNVKGDHE